MTPSGVTIGRVITYRSSTGKYDVPAIVTVTQDSFNPQGVKAGRVPHLDSPDHVHLTVFSAGGSYREWNVPYYSGFEGEPLEQVEPGTWRWPERV